MASITCPHCHQHLVVVPKSVPQNLECAGCGGEIEVPAVSSGAPTPSHPSLILMTPVEASQPSSSSNPYAPPVVGTTHPPVNQPVFHTGIGRGPFAFLLFVAAIFPIAFAVFAFSGKITSMMVMIGLITLIVLLVLYPFAKRLENIGYPSNYCLLAFIPIVSFFLMLACLVLPAGFAKEKKIDGSGVVIFFVLVGVICWAIVMFLIITKQTSSVSAL